MSCILGYKDKDNVILISDSRSSTDRYNFECTNKVDGKITRCFDNPEAIIGHVGDTRDISIIKQIPGLTNDFSDKYPEFNYDYIRNVLIPKVKKEYLDLNIYGTLYTYSFPTRLLVGCKDRLFLISECGSILKINNYHIEGSGTPAALASYTLSNEKDPLKRGIKAIQAAIKYNSFCGYPILVCSTKSNNWIVLTKEDTEAVLKGEKEVTL